MKNLCLFLFLMLINLIVVQAQSRKQDSIALKVKIAQKDAKHFKLDNPTWQEYRKHHVDYTSDYFKPNETTASDPALLSDSGYVKAYRLAAYKKNSKRRTVGHYVLVGGGIYVLVSIVVGVVVVVALLSTLK